MIFSRLFNKSEGQRGSLFLELIVVALGVILALSAEQYWAEMERSRLIDQNYSAVLAELASNREEIQSAYDYHLAAGPKSFESLDYLESRSGPIADASWYRGTQIPLLKHAAFDTALQMGVWAETNVPVAMAVNEAYACFERIEDTADYFQQALAETRRADGIRFFNIIGFAFSQLSFYEVQCLTAIDAATDALNTEE